MKTSKDFPIGCFVRIKNGSGREYKVISHVNEGAVKLEQLETIYVSAIEITKQAPKSLKPLLRII